MCSFSSRIVSVIVCSMYGTCNTQRVFFCFSTYFFFLFQSMECSSFTSAICSLSCWLLESVFIKHTRHTFVWASKCESHAIIFSLSWSELVQYTHLGKIRFRFKNCFIMFQFSFITKLPLSNWQYRRRIKSCRSIKYREIGFLAISTPKNFLFHFNRISSLFDSLILNFSPLESRHCKA